MRALGVCTMMLVLVAGGPASAQTTKPVPVLESHPTGKRPIGIEKTMSALQDQLETRGLAARPASVLLLAGDAAPRPGISDPDLTYAKIVADMNAAWSLFVSAKWDEAADVIQHVLDEVNDNPELLVTDTSHLDLKFRLMIALAMALDHLPQRSSKVSEAMTNVLRVFPARSPGRGEAWGKAGEERHAEYAKQVQTYGRGRLNIAAGSPVAQIFVEGQLRGLGNASLGDLIPGIYQVFILLPNGMARRYRVRVTANDTTYLTVRPAIDGCLWLSNSWTGLVSCADDGKVAGQLAQEWTGRDQVVVLRSGEENGRPTITGLLYRGGDEKRNARIFADDSDPDGPEKLAQFLVDGKEAPGLTVQKNDAAPKVAAPSPERTSYLLPALALGAGLAATVGGVAIQLRVESPDTGPPPEYLISYPASSLQIGGGLVSAAGLYLLLRHHDDARPPSALSKGLVLAGSFVMVGSATLHVAAPLDDNHNYRFRPLTTAGFVVGSGSLGVGLYQWLRETQGTSRLPAAALGAGLAFSASGAFLLAIDEPDGPPFIGPWEHHYWHTSPYGAICGGAGVVLLGLGWWGASQAETSTPIVTFTGDRTMVGWAGTF